MISFDGVKIPRECLLIGWIDLVGVFMSIVWNESAQFRFRDGTSDEVVFNGGLVEYVEREGLNCAEALARHISEMWILSDDKIRSSRENAGISADRGHTSYFTSPSFTHAPSANIRSILST